MNTPSLIDLKALKNLVTPKGHDAGLLKAETNASFALHLSQEQQFHGGPERPTANKRDDQKSERRTENREDNRRQEAKDPATRERETERAQQPRDDNKAEGSPETDKQVDSQAADNQETVSREDNPQTEGRTEKDAPENNQDETTEIFRLAIETTAEDQQQRSILQLGTQNDGQAGENGELKASPLGTPSTEKTETPALAGKAASEAEGRLKIKTPPIPAQVQGIDKDGKPELTSTLGQTGEDPSPEPGRGISDLAKTIKDAPQRQEAALSLAASNKETLSPMVHGTTPQAANLLLGGTPQGGKPEGGILSAADSPEGSPVNAADTKGTGALNGQLNGHLSGAKPLTPNLPTQSIAMTIAQKAQNGVQQFEIRLNPPELGRVDVRLEFGKDGQVTTHLIVERPETLDMLNKDARQLERALENAGVNLKDTGLTFSLKDQNTGSDGQSAKQQESGNKNALETAAQDRETTAEEVRYHRLTATSGLDISV